MNVLTKAAFLSVAVTGLSSEPLSRQDILGNWVDEFPVRVSRLCDRPLTYTAGSTDEIRVAKEAEKVWEDAVGNETLFEFVQENADLVFRILSPSESRSYKFQAALEGRNIYVSSAIYSEYTRDGVRKREINVFTDLTEDWQQPKAIAHEFGHFMKLPHTSLVSLNSSLMNPDIALTAFAPTKFDVRNVEDLLNTCH